MKYLKYLHYIIRHKWFVMIECFKKGLYWRGIMHDMSKFRPSEFFIYAEYFYGDKKTEALEDVFDFAWLHHQNRNKHHWQYWILQEDSGAEAYLPMPKKYMLEMICDWVGAGKAQGYHSPKDDKYKETRSWYGKNEKNMKFNTDTRKAVELEINYKG